MQIVPGTEIMADVGSHHFVKSSANSDRVLVPQPSDDPHDPLVSYTQLQTLTVYPRASQVLMMGRIGVRSGSFPP